MFVTQSNCLLSFCESNLIFMLCDNCFFNSLQSACEYELHVDEFDSPDWFKDAQLPNTVPSVSVHDPVKGKINNLWAQQKLQNLHLNATNLSLILPSFCNIIQEADNVLLRQIPGKLKLINQFSNEEMQ